MHPNYNLGPDGSNGKADSKVYIGMIRSILYLTASIPGILFNVCVCVKFQSDPRESYLTIVKWNFRYQKVLLFLVCCIRDHVTIS